MPQDRAASGLIPVFERLPRFAAAIVALTGIGVLLAWSAGLKSFPLTPGSSVMVPLAALCFTIAGIALALVDTRRNTITLRPAQQVLAAVIALVAFATFVEYAYQVSLGLDDLLFAGAVARTGRSSGRMPVNTAAAFLLFSLALLSISHDLKKRDWWSQMFASGGLLVAIVALLGYVFGVRELYSPSPYAGMPLLTAITLLVLGFGILFAQRRRAVSALLVNDGAAGVLARRLLPAAMIAPVLLGLLRLAGQKAGLYESEFGASLFAVASIVAFVTLVVWSARVLRDTDEERAALFLLEKDARAAAERARVEAETARSEAETANTIKTDFLAVMSHELRTPLTAIMGYEELLSDGITGPVTDLQKQQLNRINASAHHLLGLIDEVLTFARVDIGREKVHFESVLVNEAIALAASLVEPMAASKKIRYTLVSLPTDHVIKTDPLKFKQMLVNLLSNAVKFTDDGEVRLSAAKRGDILEISVSDTGIGIPAENMESIFEPFWQVEQNATRRAGGTGLGLSVTRKLARLLGGDVTVKTELGKGSVFTLILPFAPQTVPGSAGALSLPGRSS